VTERLRAVLDTNVFVSALLSRNPTSPTQELIRRWLNGEFTLLVCDALIDEVIEKLTEREIDRERIRLCPFSGHSEAVNHPNKPIKDRAQNLEGSAPDARNPSGTATSARCTSGGRGDCWTPAAALTRP